jgi:uncharacterized membrane protein
LVVLTPFGLTAYILHWIITSADDLIEAFPSALQPMHRFPGSGLLAAIATVLLAGAVARNLFGRVALTYVSRAVERIPVIAGLYRLFRQIAEAFLGGGGNQGFKRVVLIEWPRRDIWTLAFVTSELTGELAALTGERETLVNVFVPTTPNPTGGFHFIAKESDCRPTGLSVEAAFKIIISGGALPAAPAIHTLP